MARLPRLFVPGLPLCILHRGHGGSAIVSDDLDSQSLLVQVREAARRLQVALHAYAVLPSSLHLVVTGIDLRRVSRMMQAVSLQHGRHMALRWGRAGTLWEGRFRSTVVEPGPNLLKVCQFVETEPIRGGLVSDPAHFLASSYRHHVGIENDPSVTDHAAYWALGNTPFERQARYRSLCEEGLTSEQVRGTRERIEHGWAIGSEAFLAEIAPAASRRPYPLAKGRPRVEIT